MNKKNYIHKILLTIIQSIRHAIPVSYSTQIKGIVGSLFVVGCSDCVVVFPSKTEASYMPDFTRGSVYRQSFTICNYISY